MDLGVTEKFFESKDELCELIHSAEAFYEKNVYGKWRSGEKVSFAIHEKSLREPLPSDANPFIRMFKLSTTDEGKDVEIFVEANGKKVSFTVRVYLPNENASGENTNGTPFIVCMHPIMPYEYALKRGYAVIFLDTSMIAEDNSHHVGCFYDLYPFTEDKDEQTGELMAWSWGCSKVLDAVYGGLDKEFNLNAENSLVTGVSRWGKATAVCAAFEKRFKLAFPTCSGAGGLALWNYKSEGKTYDLSFIGADASYTYKENEPLSCLQSDAERGWFVDRFLDFKTYEDIDFNQYMLVMMAADKRRYYYINAAWTGEDWVNAPAMHSCYLSALEGYKALGLEGHLKEHFHKEGHAVLEEDLTDVLDFFDSIIGQ